MNLSTQTTLLSDLIYKDRALLWCATCGLHSAQLDSSPDNNCNRKVHLVAGMATAKAMNHAVAVMLAHLRVQPLPTFAPEGGLAAPA